MNCLSSLAGLAAILVAAVAWCWQPVGPHVAITGSKATRVGGGLDAGSRSITYQVTNTAPAPASIARIFVCNGASFGAGAWTIETERTGNAGWVAVGSATATLAANTWNAVEMGSPVDFGNGVVRFRFVPLAVDSDIEFVNALGEVTDDLWIAEHHIQASSVSIPDGGLSAVAALVVVLDGQTDPFAPADCAANERSAVAGNAYSEAADVVIHDGQSATERFDFQPWTTGSECISALSVDLAEVKASSIDFELGGAGLDSVVGTLAVSGGLGTVTLPSPFPAGDAGRALFLTLVPHGGDATWRAARAQPTDLGRCHPVSRATWGGSASFAEGQGSGADFGFAVSTVEMVTAYIDRDGDGYGDDSTTLRTCGGLPVGYVTVQSRDCDDADPLRHPGARETCNGIDDDCDGLVDADDPDLLRPNCERSLGVCAGSLRLPQSCRDGRWQACGPAEYGATHEPAESICDGLDNDCDGKVDVAACPLQEGVCSGAWRSICKAAESGECEAAYGAFYESVEKSCDGLDNDCDGQVDEACPEPRSCGCTSTNAHSLFEVAVLAALLGRCARPGRLPRGSRGSGHPAEEGTRRFARRGRGRQPPAP